MNTRPRILLTGSDGQLGRYIVARFGDLHGFVPSARTVPPSSGIALDLDDREAARSAVAATRPDIVLHAASLADVDRCERDRGAAVQSNVLATRHLVSALAQEAPSARLIYVSTDQVYPGPGPSTEDMALPQGVYAITKMWGEDAALAFGNSLVVRLNFLAAGTEQRTSLGDWLSQSLIERRVITLFEDVLFNPLYAGDLPDLLLALAQSNARGIVNLGASGAGLSKADFGRALAKRLSLPIDNARSGKLADVAMPAPRSLDTRMNVRRAEDILGIALPDIETTIDRFVADWLRRREQAT